jgi:hypothetical protein
LIYLGRGILVLAIFFNVAVASYERFNPPHDMRFWGLMAAAILYYGLLVAALFLAMGFLLNR